MAARPIADTDKAKNTAVDVDGTLTLEEMEKVLTAVAEKLGLVTSHVTTLSRKKYPGNRHWHFKQDLKSKGCLDVTYWPGGPLMWVTMRNYEPEWVHDAGTKMAKKLKKALSSKPRVGERTRR